jgi:hypothetical protein
MLGAMKTKESDFASGLKIIGLTNDGERTKTIPRPTVNGLA